MSSICIFHLLVIGPTISPVVYTGTGIEVMMWKNSVMKILAFRLLQDRVGSAGGSIFLNNGLRVMGVLAMTRAIGDKFLRKYVEMSHYQHRLFVLVIEVAAIFRTSLHCFTRCGKERNGLLNYQSIV